ncbi:MAG: HAD family hydrolase [Candidatus Omnitrophica bacterium]|nr:HAD family hydrolase [Candidatus Omnitrophota bacterium]MDD5545975.1 HAD family hydrolase [Candidatus Omnitrophota bacterium]
MIKAIVFDFDGVLVESVDIKTNAFARLFEDEGPEIVKQVVDYHVRHTGVSRFDKIKYFYKTLLKKELTERRFKELCERFSGLVLEEVVNAPYVKGGREFLEAYSAGYKCFIASATPQEEIEEIAQKRKMARYFAGIYGAPKSKSAIVKDILSGNRLSPGEAVYVGDAMSDYSAAKDNGVRFIARINGNTGIFAAVDCLKINDLSGLSSILGSL